MQSQKDITDSLASIVSYCNINKLIDNITKSFGEGATTFFARITTALINELPNDLDDYLNAETDTDRGIAAGHVVQVAFNWSI
jgi:hypothetical protein